MSGVGDGDGEGGEMDGEADNNPSECVCLADYPPHLFMTSPKIVL